MLATKASPDLVMLSIQPARQDKTLDKKRTAIIRSFIQDLFIHAGPPASLSRYMAYECKPDCSACFCKRVEFVREETGAFLNAYHHSRVSVQPYSAIQELNESASFPLTSVNEIYGLVGNDRVMMYFLFEVGSEKLVSFCSVEQKKYFFAF
ncbi:hypothetical protein [uncultured Chitinophaga sp.]|uniref:hypothetical protein n=1 Tax=uncultured Chitinophaga sp. TaxID=339340 RepID=UPI0025EBCD0A|nr:hypothetical protein [uncultured Chitinophaga sp.]